jgi:hypothetical protein
MKTKNLYSKLKNTLAMLVVCCSVSFFPQKLTAQSNYKPLEDVNSLQGMIDLDWHFSGNAFDFIANQTFPSRQKIRYVKPAGRNSDTVKTQEFYFTNSNSNPAITFDLKVNRGGYSGSFLVHLLDENDNYLSLIQSQTWSSGLSSGKAGTFSFSISPAGLTQSGFYRIALIFSNINPGNGKNTQFDIESFSIPITLLPVTYSHFTATQNSGQVILNWSTVTETNNSHFEIERSSDGEQWLTLGQVQGSGNSHELNVYEYIDVNPLSGTNYYRLKQVDFNGDFSYSELKVVIIDFVLPEKVTIYPNPALSFINIDIPDGVDFVKTEIRSIDGRIIEINEFQNQLLVQLTVSHLLPGIYYLHIQMGDQLLVNPFVKQ